MELKSFTTSSTEKRKNKNNDFRWSQTADDKKRLKLELEKKTLRTVTIVQLQSLLDIFCELGRLTGELIFAQIREVGEVSEDKFKLYFNSF